MFVKDKMTRDPYTIQVSASINTLIGLMRDKKLRKVPVLDGEKLVGIVTDRDIERVSPSKATSLSVYEINYLLSKITVADAMVSDVKTCSPDDYIEDAALHRINGNGHVVMTTLARCFINCQSGNVTQIKCFNCLIYPV